MSFGEAFLRSTPSFYGLGFATISASASSCFLSGLLGAALMYFLLGSALVFPDRVITTFTFFFSRAAGCLGKSLSLGCGNADATCAIRVSNILLKLSRFCIATVKLLILLSILSKTLSLARNFLPNSAFTPS
jgi:hypothetical protein